MKLLIALPVVLSTAAFILSLLSLLAGYKDSFMEDYNIMTLNTSQLGQQAVREFANGNLQLPTATTGNDESAIASAIASATASLPPAEASEVASAAATILGEIGSDLARSLADELGISEFYSIHAMDFCQGRFRPNATTLGASHNVTNCSTPLDFAAYNFTDELNKQLSIGPINFTISDLGVTSDIQNALDMLPKYAKALAAIFIVGVILAGLSMVLSFLAFLLIPRMGRTLAFFNWVLALLASIVLIASALVATIAPREVTNLLNQHGADTIGLGIITNTKLLAITWAAFGTMVLSMFYWFYELIVECCLRRRTKTYSTSSYEK